MAASAISILRCPVCGAAGTLSENGRSFCCFGERSHTYDFAKSGYLNLSRSQKSGGDGAEAVCARSAFLEKGYYRPLADRVRELLDRFDAQTVIDAGCGEGYYTARMAREGRTLLGFDLSKPAVDHAAKRMKHALNTEKTPKSTALFAVASLFELPVADACADAVVNLFAPCAESEFCRVLKPNGVLVVVGAGKNHLMGLKRVLYETPYQNQPRADLPVSMKPIAREELTFQTEICGQADIDALFSMTPYYFRTSRSDRAKLAALETLTTELSFDIFCYRKEENAP